MNSKRHIFVTLIILMTINSFSLASSNCRTKMRKKSDFISFFEKSIDAKAKFNNLSNGARFVVGEEYSGIKALQGKTVVVDYSLDLRGNAIVYTGKVSQVDSKKLTLNTLNGDILIPLRTGVDGITSLSVVNNEGSIKQISNENFDSLFDSNQRYKKLSKGGIEIISSQYGFAGMDSALIKLIEPGSEIIINYLDDAFGRSRLVRGTLVNLTANFLNIDVNGTTVKINTEWGVGGLTAISVF